MARIPRWEEWAQSMSTITDYRLQRISPPLRTSHGKTAQDRYDAFSTSHLIIPSFSCSARKPFTLVYADSHQAAKSLSFASVVVSTPVAGRLTLIWSNSKSQAT